MAAHGSPEDQNRTVSADVYETMAWYGYNTKYNWPGATEAEAMAAPGQLTIPLVANLDFTAGARYEKTEKKLDYRYEESRTDTGERLAYDAYTVDDDSDTFLPKGVLSWTMPPPRCRHLQECDQGVSGGWAQRLRERPRQCKIR